MAKKNGGGATAPKPVVKPAPKVAPKAPTAPKAPAPKPLTASQAYNKAYSTAGKTAAKTAAKTAGKTLLKTAGKAALKGVPYVGAAIGAYELGSAAYDAYKDYKKTNAPKGTRSAMSSIEKLKGIKLSQKEKPSSTTVAEKPKEDLNKDSSSVSGKGSGTSNTKTGGSGASKTGGNAPAKSPISEKPKEAAATVTSAPKKPGIRMTAGTLPSKISKDANLQKSKPVDVSYKPTASSPKKKTKAELVDSGKTKRGTMKVNAQVKIAAIRKKERAASQKAERVENKAGRVAKRTAIKSAKANVKAIRKGK